MGVFEHMSIEDPLKTPNKYDEEIKKKNSLYKNVKAD